MSTTPQGPGWWQASDGNWYPPELAPGAATQPPPASTPPAPSGPPATPSSPATPRATGSEFAMGGGSRSRRAPDAAEITVLAGAGVVLIASFLAFYEVSAG